MYTLILIHAYGYIIAYHWILLVVLLLLPLIEPYLCDVKACCLPKWAFHTGVGCATRLSSIVSVGTAPGSFAETNRAGRNFFSQNETAGLSAENPSERRNGGGYIKNLLHKTNKLASGLTQKPDWIPPFLGRGISQFTKVFVLPTWRAIQGADFDSDQPGDIGLSSFEGHLSKRARTSSARQTVPTWRAFGRRTPGTKRPSEDLKALADLP